MIRKGMSALVICLMLTNVQAQTLEVIVEDKVELAATSFVYEIAIDGLSEMLWGLDSMDDEGEGMESDAITIDELKEKLKREKFEFTITNENSFILGENADDLKALEVYLPSLAELKRFYESMKTIDGLNGFVKKTNYESIDTHSAEIYKRVATMAKKEATALAGAFGKQTGNMVSIKEVDNVVTNPLGSLMDNYMSLMKRTRVFGSAFGDDFQAVSTVTRKYIVSFELK